jgi:hypothetical protein
MRPKKGNDLPKVGRVLHPKTPDATYVREISDALKQELGATHQAIKLAMRWTGASERTVKYWFAGFSGPNGTHLIALARHSDLILKMFLRKAGRHHYVMVLQLAQARETLRQALHSIEDIVGDGVTTEEGYTPVKMDPRRILTINAVAGAKGVNCNAIEPPKTVAY